MSHIIPRPDKIENGSQAEEDNKSNKTITIIKAGEIEQETQENNASNRRTSQGERRREKRRKRRQHKLEQKMNNAGKIENNIKDTNQQYTEEDKTWGDEIQMRNNG